MRQDRTSAELQFQNAHAKRSCQCQTSFEENTKVNEKMCHVVCCHHPFHFEVLVFTESAENSVIINDRVDGKYTQVFTIYCQPQPWEHVVELGGKV